MKNILTLLILACSITANSQVQTICGGSVPAGWVTISVNGTCSTVNGVAYMSRTIKKIDGLATNTVMSICGDPAPAGWVTISVNGTCATFNGIAYMSRTIKKIDGSAANTTLNICGDPAPAGWVTIFVNGTCATFNGIAYTSRTIKKIAGVPINTVVNVCGDPAPAGWVTTSVNGTCATVNNVAYTGRTIKKISAARMIMHSGNAATSLKNADNDINNTQDDPMQLLLPDVIISPNPSSSNFKMELSGFTEHKMIEFAVYDMVGKLVETSNINNANSSVIIGANYNAGLYILKVTQGSTVKIIRLKKD